MKFETKSTRRATTAATSRLLRSALFIAVGVGLALSLSASAEWRVYDDSVESELKEVNKKLASQNKVGAGDFKNDDPEGEKQGRFKDPPKKFTTADQDKPSSVELSEATRCPKPTPPKAPKVDGISSPPSIPASGNGIPDQQWKICKEIVETELAQFKYSLMMSELAQKRYERLKEIQQQRESIGGDNAGELTSNTNKMLALSTLIQIDQQQHTTYNDAYAARLAYLRSVRERLGQMAINGSRGNDSAAGGGVTGPIGGGGSPGGGGSSTQGDLAAMGVMALAFSENSPIRAKRRGD